MLGFLVHTNQLPEAVHENTSCNTRDQSQSTDDDNRQTSWVINFQPFDWGLDTLDIILIGMMILSTRMTFDFHFFAGMVVTRTFMTIPTTRATTDNLVPRCAFITAS